MPIKAKVNTNWLYRLEKEIVANFSQNLLFKDDEFIIYDDDGLVDFPTDYNMQTSTSVNFHI